MVDEAISLVRSVAFRQANREGYSLDAIKAEMNTYQRVDDEGYGDFAFRILDAETIQREWRETAARATKLLSKTSRK